MSALLKLAERVIGARETESRWLRLLASTRRGVPWREHDDVPDIIPMTQPPPVEKIPVEVTVTQNPPPPTPPVQVNVTHDGPAAPAPAESKPGLPTWATAAMLLGGGALAALGGAGAMNYFSESDTTTQTDTIIERGSLLQYLEDNGWHLPSE